MSTNFPPFNPYATITPDPSQGDFLYSTDTPDNLRHWTHDPCRLSRTIYMRNGRYTDIVPKTRAEWCEICWEKYQKAQGRPPLKPPPKKMA